jgi:GxxExxY protein
MHPDYERASKLTGEIIGCAIEVHRDEEPGLIESIFEWCLSKELDLREISWVAQKAVNISYKGFTREDTLRFDLLVEGCVLDEANAVTKVLRIH